MDERSEMQQGGRIAAQLCAGLAIALALAVIVVDWAWPYYWHVESAMQFVFFVGPLAIGVFLVSLAMQAFRTCRSVLGALLNLLWLVIAIGYFLSGEPR
jgi:hypothetical protein